MVTPPYHKQIIYLQEIDAYVEKFKINKSVLVMDHTVGKMDRCAQGGRLFCIFYFINGKYIYLYWNANCHPFILFNCLLENQFNSSIIAIGYIKYIIIFTHKKFP